MREIIRKIINETTVDIFFNNQNELQKANDILINNGFSIDVKKNNVLSVDGNYKKFRSLMGKLIFKSLLFR